MQLFKCFWFKYRLIKLNRFIKLDLVTVGKFCFRFSRALGSVVDCVNVNSSARALKICLAGCVAGCAERMRTRTNNSRHSQQAPATIK